MGTLELLFYEDLQFLWGIVPRRQHKHIKTGTHMYAQAVSLYKRRICLEGCFMGVSSET